MTTARSRKAQSRNISRPSSPHHLRVCPAIPTYICRVEMLMLSYQKPPLSSQTMARPKARIRAYPSYLSQSIISNTTIEVSGSWNASWNSHRPSHPPH
jgi:hypothetical protein